MGYCTIQCEAIGNKEERVFWSIGEDINIDLRNKTEPKTLPWGNAASTGRGGRGFH